MYIVTHHAPDLDAITATWLIRRFLPNWKNAKIAFVPAGKTLKNEIVDSDPQVMHVDTGFGLLDHHQTSEHICAATKTYAYLTQEVGNGGKGNKNSENWNDEALDRMCEVVNFYDHFGEAGQTDAIADYHVFEAISILDGIKTVYPDDDSQVMDFGFMMLDAIYKSMQEKIWAEEIMDEGIKFETQWGKGLGFETVNDGVLKYAQKSGFVVVLRKDPKKGYVRIKGLPGTRVDFTKAYEILKLKDAQATWYLHSSKKILLNGTTKNPDMKPTILTLQNIIDVLKS